MDKKKLLQAFEARCRRGDSKIVQRCHLLAENDKTPTRPLMDARHSIAEEDKKIDFEKWARAK